MLLAARCLRGQLPAGRLLASTFSTNAPSAATGVQAGGEFVAGNDNPVRQRYLKLVDSGLLKHDANQWAVITQLGELYDQVVQYKGRFQDYLVELEKFQAARDKRLKEVAEEDERKKAAGGQQAAPQPAKVPLLRSLGQMLGLLDPERPRPPLDPAVLARIAARRREERVAQEMGTGPAPPEPPKGLYVYGSVGSGKTLLMDMFYDAVEQQAGLPSVRRMHFNAAMLEVHSRLHKLDTELARQREERLKARQAMQAAGLAVTGSDEDGDDDEVDDEECAEEGCGSGCSSGGCSSGGCSSGGCSSGKAKAAEAKAPAPTPEEEVYEALRPMSRLPLNLADPEVAKQKEMKLAILAVKRQLRLSRLGRRDPGRLGRSNSLPIRLMAHSLIRGGSLAALAWQPALGSSRVPALLCFDEMQITDAFNAAALKGIFEMLAEEGCVVVITSNRAPQELQPHGLHESLFNHFITTLLDTCKVVELSSAADYRLLLKEGAITNSANAATASNSVLQPGSVYLQPLGPESHARMEGMWQRLKNGGSEESREIEVMFGRTLAAPRCSGRAAWFTFDELCGTPLGAADYMAVAQNFNTVFITDIPAMSMQVRDQARRFITLVDELYNARCRLVASAAVLPDQLFAGAENAEPILDLEGLQFETAVDGARLRRNVSQDGGIAPVAATPEKMVAAVAQLGGMEEKFAFRRAVSRLYEMQSNVYLSLGAR